MIYLTIVQIVSTKVCLAVKMFIEDKIAKAHCDLIKAQKKHEEQVKKVWKKIMEEGLEGI